MSDPTQPSSEPTQKIDLDSKNFFETARNLTTDNPDGPNEKNIVKRILDNPAEMAKAMQGMNLTNEKMRQILSDVKNDPEAMKQVSDIADDSVVGQTIKASFAKQQSGNHLTSKPQRKKVLKMQKAMKKATREAIPESNIDIKKYSIVFMNRSSKLKMFVVPDDNYMNEIKRLLDPGSAGLEINNIEKTISGQKYTFVCSKGGGKNTRMNALLGKDNGSEFVVFMGDTETIVGDITIESFESYERANSTNPPNRNSRKNMKNKRK